MWYMNEERQVLVIAFRNFVNKFDPSSINGEEDAFLADALLQAR